MVHCCAIHVSPMMWPERANYWAISMLVSIWPSRLSASAKLSAKPARWGYINEYPPHRGYFVRASGLFPPPLWGRVGGTPLLGSIILTPPTSALPHERRGGFAR